MLEKKRRHSRSAMNDIDDNSFNPPSKKQCCDYTNCMEYEPATLVPNNRIPSFQISEKELENMVTTVNSEDIGMEVEETHSSSRPEEKSLPNCAKCAAGQGGHISHIMS